jgi:hypothetical protein
MKTAIRISLAALALALASLALPGWVAATAQRSSSAHRENLSFELQNGSFSSLSWSITEFKVLFSRRYRELLIRIQEFQRNLPPSERAVVNARLADILEETLAEAQTAVPVAAMQEHLLWFYRVAGLTNRHVQANSTSTPANTP